MFATRVVLENPAELSRTRGRSHKGRLRPTVPRTELAQDLREPVQMVGARAFPVRSNPVGDATRAETRRDVRGTTNTYACARPRQSRSVPLSLAGCTFFDLNNWEWNEFGDSTPEAVGVAQHDARANVSRQGYAPSSVALPSEECELASAIAASTEISKRWLRTGRLSVQRLGSH